MVKHTEKKGVKKQPKQPLKTIHKSEFAKYIRSKFQNIKVCSRQRTLDQHQIKEILHQQALECPICLQIFLKPALAECGHIFCLSCAQQLAQKDYACGICRNLEPNYDLTIDKTYQQLVNIYLKNSNPEQRLNYEKRQKILQEKECKRQIQSLNVGDYVDFWCTQAKSWKSCQVKQIYKYGTILLGQIKSSKQTQVNIISRRLAKHRSFTKEQIIVVDQTTNLIPTFRENFAAPPMYGVPLFFNFFDNHDQNNSFGGFDSNGFYGFMPRFRPFST